MKLFLKFSLCLDSIEGKGREVNRGEEKKGERAGEEGGRKFSKHFLGLLMFAKTPDLANKYSQMIADGVVKVNNASLFIYYC